MKSQKNDANDAEAICEAVTRPQKRFVPQKSVEQQDLQCLHRVRSRLVACRTQLINQIRGLLAEYGIVLPQHPGQVRRGSPAVLEDAENRLTGAGRELFRSLYEELAVLWRVDDSVSRDLMKSFYEEMMKKGNDAPEALRRSQFAIMRRRRSSASYFWAGFKLVSIGN